MIRFAILFLCLLTLGLAPARAQVLTSIPSAAAGDAKAFWSAVMEEFYGPYDKRAKCWTGAVDGERLCMRPHLLSTVAIDGESVHFVAMAGYAPGPDGSRADCHACGGKLGLAILKETGDRLALVARNDLAADAGSWGQVPPEEFFRVVELGKGNHGWLMEFFYTGQGYTEGGVGVFGAVGDKILDMGFISTHSDNAGTCGDGMGACFVYSYEILSDPAGSDARFGELIARKLESTKADAPETIRIPFSEQALKYETPAALEAALDN
ncbi:MAG: hypothetical protein U1A06_15730 [Hoeflea sp.]|uniref:hypothetical protein n=1 Tax=Hoeflea sp. TaxID=1940281 RepID=UPI002730CB37|nr:hypothetical protein [Hoeflea sp.]MDP2120956.1 hypothetical protein [Hoeflea sp.]MDZ7602816.1 hypothetical protein [Hoeflea sp.]